jgi:N4-gp56 family major capsid protein
MATMKDMLPKQSGRSVQFYRYNNLSANTTATTEGTVGTSTTFNSRVLTATVSQYTAFITVSDLLKNTALDPIVQNAAELLGYSAGLSVDTITRNVIDAESSSTDQALLATNLKVSDLRNAVHSLQAVDVQPFDDGEFFAIVHPYASFDLVNDPNAMGLADILKYNTDVKASPLVRYEDRGLITHIAGCKVITSTNVKTQTTPNRYRAYVFGKGAIGCVDLAGSAPSNVVDPRNQRFKINIVPGKPQIADPEGVIGAAVSYNFVFTVIVLEGPTGIGGTYRYVTLDPQSTIA